MKIDDLLREEETGWTEIRGLIDPLSSAWPAVLNAMASRAGEPVRAH